MKNAGILLCGSHLLFLGNLDILLNINSLHIQNVNCACMHYGSVVFSVWMEGHPIKCFKRTLIVTVYQPCKIFQPVHALNGDSVNDIMSCIIKLAEYKNSC